MKKVISGSILILYLSIAGSISVQAQGTLIDFSTIPKSGTILIYSHMDDDLIWMLPFWSITEKFIGGAMPATPWYRTIIRQQQEFMNNNGYNINYESNWFTPWSDVTDQEYTEYYWGDNPSYSYLVRDHLETRLYNNPTELSRYEINKIKAKLEQFFARPDMDRVITHNNWGEYGHKHHIGINKAVRELAVKYRKDVWMLGCDNGGFVDVTVPNGITFTYGKFNTPDLYTGIRAIYQNNRRWSWYEDRIPSGDHKFIKIVDRGSDKSYILKGDGITLPGPSQYEPGAYIFDGTDDYLTLEGNNYTSFTISMRIRPALIKEMDISCMAEYPSSGSQDHNLYLNGDGRISLRYFDGAFKTITSDRAVSAAQWTHIAVTGSVNGLKLYINGVPDRAISTSLTSMNYVTPEFILGQAGITGSYFEGQINDVGLFNEVLTDSRIAKLSGAAYTITSTGENGGDINPAGTVNVFYGDSYTYNITPEEGYAIEDVKVDNLSVGAVRSFTFGNITGNHTISASFRHLTYTVTCTVTGSGGSVNPQGSKTVNYGSSLVVGIFPDIGYHISDVKVDGVSVGITSEVTLDNIIADHLITAQFSINSYSISASSGVGGTITPAGQTDYNYGTDQIYIIVPYQGYRIADVAVDNASVGDVSIYTFEGISDNHTISVRFIRIYEILVKAGPGGSISPGGTLSVPEGEQVNFSIIPESGYCIQDVKVDNNSIGDPSEYLFTRVSSDHSISAIFTREITTNVFPNPFRETLNIEIKSPPEYRFDIYFEDTGTRLIYKMTDIAGDGIIPVRFNFSTGLYILKIYRNGNNISTFKIIKSQY